MLVIPLPLAVALVLGFLLIKRLVAGHRPVLFSLLLAICAMQSLIVALAQYYGLAMAQVVQPITATWIPPVAWLAFSSAAFRPGKWTADWPHLLPPLFSGFCLLFAPATLDPVIVGVFAGYGGAMVLTLVRSGPDLPMTSLQAGPIPYRIWQAVAAVLLVSAAGDLAIAIAFSFGWESLLQPIVSAGSALTLLGIGLLSLMPAVQAPVEITVSGEQDAEADPPPEPSEVDRSLVNRLDAFLETQPLYLDPGLTLNRLSSRMKVPAKQLSAAVNRVKGENVSRLINAYRIAHACRLLEAGGSVTGAMLDSGFNTKSNFNREFSRVTGKSPCIWRDLHRAVADPAAKSATPEPIRRSGQASGR